MVAPRPRMEGLQNYKIEQIGLNNLMRSWPKALEDYVNKIKQSALI